MLWAQSTPKDYIRAEATFWRNPGLKDSTSDSCGPKRTEKGESLSQCSGLLAWRMDHSFYACRTPLRQTFKCHNSKTELVGWYSEPSQAQPDYYICRAKNKLQSVSCLKTMHTSHQTTNSPKTTKSVPTQMYIKQNIHKHQTQNFRRISPFGIAPVKKKSA